MSGPDKGAVASLRWRQSIETLYDARLLLGAGGFGRSVVNRSYYAAFYSITALLDLSGKTARRHADAISTFDIDCVRTGKAEKTISKRLHRLFETRLVYDYFRLEAVSSETARAAVGAAESIMAASHAVLAESLDGLPGVSSGPY